MKAAMKVLTGLDMGPARQPLSTLDDRHLPAMKQSLQQLNLLP